MKNTYTPKPIDTSTVELPEELNALGEQIAANVHDVWAQNRIEQGWQYGPERDDTRKLHPCLVPYDRLPEEEKTYDRETAFSTLKMIYELGFVIHKNE